jgi:hypothetical protein
MPADGACETILAFALATVWYYQVQTNLLVGSAAADAQHADGAQACARPDVAAAASFAWESRQQTHQHPPLRPIAPATRQQRYALAAAL